MASHAALSSCVSVLHEVYCGQIGPSALNGSAAMSNGSTAMTTCFELTGASQQRCNKERVGREPCEDGANPFAAADEDERHWDREERQDRRHRAAGEPPAHHRNRDEGGDEELDDEQRDDERAVASSSSEQEQAGDREQQCGRPAGEAEAPIDEDAPKSVNAVAREREV